MHAGRGRHRPAQVTLARGQGREPDHPPIGASRRGACDPGPAQMPQTVGLSHENPPDHNPQDDHKFNTHDGAPPTRLGLAARMTAAGTNARHLKPIALGASVPRCPSSGHVDACALEPNLFLRLSRLPTLTHPKRKELRSRSESKSAQSHANLRHNGLTPESCRPPEPQRDACEGKKLRDEKRRMARGIPACLPINPELRQWPARSVSVPCLRGSKLQQERRRQHPLGCLALRGIHSHKG